MAFSLNGSGTRYYGTKYLPDGTYITTKWLVFLYVPVIPLRSVRVLKEDETYGSLMASSQKLSVQMVPLDLEMVLRTYAWVMWAAVVLGILYGLDQMRF